MNKGMYLIYRIMGFFIQVLGGIFIVFVLFNMLPYDPTTILKFILLSSGLTGAEVDKILAQVRHQYRLDQPAYVQYFLYLKDIIQKHTLGGSWYPVGELDTTLSASIKLTAQIFGTAFLIYTPIAITLGIYSAIKEGERFDQFSKAITMVFYAVPSFVLGVFFVAWGAENNLAPWPNLPNLSRSEEIRFMILPILTISLSAIGFQFRLVRDVMLEILQQKYLVTARAKGLPERTVIFKHAMKNGIPRILMTIAVTFPVAITGVAFLEVIFRIPGIGFFMVQAAVYFDWYLILGATTVFIFITGLVLLIVDVLIMFIDPRRSRI